MTNKLVILAVLAVSACSNSSSGSRGGNNDFAIMNCALRAGVQGEIAFSRAARGPNSTKYVWGENTSVSPSQQAQIDACVGGAQ